MIGQSQDVFTIDSCVFPNTDYLFTEVFFLSCFPKDPNMAGAEVIIPNSLKIKSNRFHMVSWLNNLLKTNFRDVRNAGSGE